MSLMAEGDHGSGPEEEPPFPEPPSQSEASTVHEVVLIPAAREHLDYASTAAELLATVDGGEKLAVHVHESLDLDSTRAQWVVVAPSTARGMADASTRIVTWPCNLAPPALMVVRDAPLPPPRIVVQRVRSLAERVMLSVELPYLYRLRELEAPARVLQGRRRDVRRARRELAKICHRLYGATFLAAGGGPGEPVPLALEKPVSSLTDPAPSRS